MNLQRKQTYHKPWAQRCPGVSEKSKRNKRPLAVAKQSTQRSATKTIKRPLAARKQTKPLSAPADKRAEKLRKLKNKELRHGCAMHRMVSRKVNKVISGTKQNQSETRIPRVKNTKVFRTQTRPKIIKKTAQARKKHTPQEHKSVLDHPLRNLQVNIPKALTITSILRTNLRLKNSPGYKLTGNNKIGPGYPGPNKTHSRTYTENSPHLSLGADGKNHKEYNGTIKVNTKNEFLYTKETATQEITPPGPKTRTMSEENYTSPPTKLPDQILETPEVLNQDQEPDDSETGMADIEKMMECPFSCTICREAFATPQELQNHVLNHRRSTPKPQGTHGAQDPRPGSSFSPQGAEEEVANTDPVIDLQETLEFPEPPTQEATHGLAPDGEVEEEPNTGPNLFLQDTLIIPETPDQKTTHRSAPGGEVEDEPNTDPNLFLQDTLIIPETPEQEAAHESAPGGEVEEEPIPDHNLFLPDTLEIPAPPKREANHVPVLDELEDTPKSDALAPSEPRTPEKYREPPIQMTTPGTPPGRESEAEPSTPAQWLFGPKKHSFHY